MRTKNVLVLSAILLGIFLLACSTPAERQQQALDATASADIVIMAETRQAKAIEVTATYAIEQIEASMTVEAKKAQLDAQVERDKLAVERIEAQTMFESEQADTYMKKSQADLLTFKVVKDEERQDILINNLVEGEQDHKALEILNDFVWSLVILLVIAMSALGTVLYYQYRNEYHDKPMPSWLQH